jgi:hypothetical protein
MYDGSSWLFLTPKEGWRVWIDDENEFYYYDENSNWVLETTLIPTAGPVNYTESGYQQSVSSSNAGPGSDLDTGDHTITGLDSGDHLAIIRVKVERDHGGGVASSTYGRVLNVSDPDTFVFSNVDMDDQDAFFDGEPHERTLITRVQNGHVIRAQSSADGVGGDGSTASAAFEILTVQKMS